MRKIIVVLILVTIFTFNTSCNYSDDYNTTENVYKINPYGISMEIPDKWQMDYDYAEYKSFSYYEYKKIVENLSFNLYENYSSNQCLDEVLFGLEESDALYNNVENVKNGEIVIGGEKAYHIDYNSDGREYKLIILETCNNAILISFYSTSGVGYEEFQKAIKTIEIVD